MSEKDMEKNKKTAPILTYSRIRTFCTCPMSEHFAYTIGGVGIKTTAPQIPFIEGEFGHYALAHFHEKGIMLRKNMLDKASDMIKALGPLDVEMARKLDITIAAMTGACLAYKDRYRDDVDRGQKDGKGSVIKGKYQSLAVEKEFEIDFDGIKIRGKIDWLVKDRKDGTVIIWENKFVGGLSPSNYAVLPLDLQGLIYCLGVKEIIGKLPDFKGWNYILKSRLRQKDGESSLQFESRVAQQYLDAPAEKFFRPPPLIVERTTLENLKKQLAVVIARILDEPRHMEFNCLGKWGRPCPFVEACRSKLQGKGDGWDAPENRGIYKLKEQQHEELTED